MICPVWPAARRKYKALIHWLIIHLIKIFYLLWICNHTVWIWALSAERSHQFVVLTKFWTSWATKSLTHHFQPWQLHNLSPNFKAWMFPSLSSKLAIESLQLSFPKPFHLQKRALTSYLGLPVDKVVWPMEWEGGLSEAVSGVVWGGDDSKPTWDVKTLFWGLWC